MLEFVSRPFHQDPLEHVAYAEQGRDPKLPVVLYPASQLRIEHVDQVLQVLVGSQMYLPASHLIPYCLLRFAADGGGEADEVFSVLASDESRLKGISEKVKLRILERPFSLSVLTIHNLRLLLID